MSEKALLLGKDRTLVGIISSREKFTVSRNNKIGVLLLNAGLIHHVGPNRIYVKLARKLAERGLTVIRFDMSGIGDSRPSTETRPQEELMLSEIREAMDYLQRNNGVERFISIGLCSGAALAFLIAENDPRIIGAVLINPLVPKSEQTRLMSVFQYYSKQALFRKSSWLKLFTMQSDFKTIWKTIHLRIKQKIIPHFIERSESAEVTEHLKSSFQILLQRKVKLLFVSSETEIGYSYLEELLGTSFLGMVAADLLHSEFLKETDHGITPISSQNLLIDVICTWIQEKGKFVEETILSERIYLN